MPKFRKKAFVIAVFLAAIVLSNVLSFSAYRSLSTSLARRKQEEFEAASSLLSDTIQQRLQRYGNLVRTSASFVESIPNLEMTSLEPYVTGVLENEAYKSVYGIGYIHVVPHEQMNTYISNLNAEYLRTDSLHPTIRIYPDTANMIHYILAYNLPYKKERDSALGFDFGAEPLRAAAIDYSLQHNGVAVSPMVRGIGENVSLLLYLYPVVSSDGPIGFSFVSVRTQSLLGDTQVSFETKYNLYFSLRDITNAKDGEKGQFLTGVTDENVDDSYTVTNKTFEYGGREYLLQSYKDLTADNFDEASIKTIAFVAFLILNVWFILLVVLPVVVMMLVERNDSKRSALLQAAMHKYETIFNIVPCSILIYKPNESYSDAEILECNATFLKEIGKPISTVLHTNVCSLIAIDPADKVNMFIPSKTSDEMLTTNVILHNSLKTQLLFFVTELKLSGQRYVLAIGKSKSDITKAHEESISSIGDTTK